MSHPSPDAIARTARHALSVRSLLSHRARARCGRGLPAVAAALLAWFAAPSASGAADAASCLAASGGAAHRCLRQVSDLLDRCALASDPACVDGLDAEIDARVARIPGALRARCDDDVAIELGYLDLADIAQRTGEACRDFAADFFDRTFGEGDSGAALLETRRGRRCQATVAHGFARVRDVVVAATGRRCIVQDFRRGTCDRAARDARIAARVASEARRIEAACGTAFDELGLTSLDPSASTLSERIDQTLGVIVNRAQHFAIFVYPPNDLGPTARFGPFPVGVRTLALSDPSRTNVPGNAARPVTVEVFYPAGDVAPGTPPDTVVILGIPIADTPNFRGVEVAEGSFPLLLFSHGNNGLRIQSLFWASHLASHGYVVVSPDHHGNTFIDQLQGLVDPNVATNRPIDMSFLIDEFLARNTAPGDFLEGRIDPDKIAMSGHSFGGFTTWSLGNGPLEDPRVKALLPLAPASGSFDEAFFGGIEVPVMVLGGSLDETTPFPGNQLAPFEALRPGAAVVALGELADAGHFSFSDFCEVPRGVLSFIGGFDEACEPRHLPWRRARDIISYLSLAFLDGVLRDDEAALGRLAAEVLAPIENLAYQDK